jgi:polyisoprenoid-binding protein YceI
MKKLFFVLLAAAALQSNAQRYVTKTGTVDFLSKAPMETISGVNRASACLIDADKGKVDVIIQIKSFVFKQQLLQEHFNENYMESDKYPRATFSGMITNLSSINFEKDGEYKADVAGKLTIHGVTQDVKESGRIMIKNGKPTVLCSFAVLLADYKIEIPGAVKDKIAKEVKINLNAPLEKTK